MNKNIVLRAVSVLFLSSLILSTPLRAEVLSQAEKDQLETLKQKALNSNLAYELVESITTEVGPRRVGTPGDAQGVKWAVAKMKALGFDKVWTEDVTFHQWTRGTVDARIIAPYPQKMVAIALGGSVPTPKGGLEAEVVHFENFAALEAAEEGSLTGKIAFVSYRMERKIDGSGYGPAVGTRVAGAAMAASKGAVAMIMRSVGTDNNRIGHTGSMRYKDGVAKIPAAALSNPDADILVNQLKRGKPVTFHLNLTSEMGEHIPVTTQNVIGEITGSESPEDFVVLAAHLDSWDVGTGAVDDGIGVGITLATAHHLMSLPQRPKRSVRVILFAAEEVGLVGVDQYLEANLDKIDRHVIGAEWDFGVGRIYEMVPGVGPMALNAIRELASYMAPLGVSLSPKNDAKGQSDLSRLGKAGMPAVNLSPDGSKYFDYHHTENDTLDKVNAEDMKQNTAVFTLFAYFAAQSGVNFRQ